MKPRDFSVPVNIGRVVAMPFMRIARGACTQAAHARTQAARRHTTIFVLIAALLVLAAFSALFLLAPRVAFAEPGDSQAQPTVLLIDSSLGDFDAFKLHWLGENSEEVVSKGEVSLLTAKTPLWWNAASESTTDAPATFLLASPAQKPILADDIIWALDEIAASGAQAKTFIVSVGASGLQTRVYAEDLASVKQSSRADLVGMVFLGTPHQGYSVAAEYPKLSLWSDLATASGFEAKDVLPESDFLQELNSNRFPNIAKSFQINGSIGDMGFGLTDGASMQADMVFPNVSSIQVQTTTAQATISQQVGLSAYWMPYAGSGRQEKPIDSGIAERLSAMNSYVTLPDIQVRTREFYEAWFSDGSPVTHISSVLTLDISGSMLEPAGDGQTKFDAAKLAAKDYMQVVEARSTMAHAVPTDVAVLAFDTNVQPITSGSNALAQEMVSNIVIGDDTDIGKALRSSLDALMDSPTSADKRILLLSDGMADHGLSNSEILAGPVAEAKKSGIIIDTIAFGTFDQADAAFLREVAQNTGGNFYESTDTYGLKVNFLKAYYTSLGLNLFDAETNPATEKNTVLGSLADGVLSLEIGVLADGETPGFKLMRDGEVLDADAYSSQAGDDGLLTIQLESPDPGEYTLVLDSAAKRAHVFAVRQLDLFKKPNTSGEAPDNSKLFLIGTGVALAAALGGVVVLSQRSRKKSKHSLDAENTGLSAASATSAGSKKGR
ncbi:MAG: VWA domain-containing protein [Eggerthellaceae bacterium]|jgi:hypothetical protein|nr:VWA domain-containing protein [Eggerthellaceae bacterium]MDR2721410.1 VWA domain-containing protein [Coriobacteriaceae bacterium]